MGEGEPLPAPGRPLKYRTVSLILILLLVGLPFLVMAQLLQGPLEQPVPPGPQPGGLLRVSVRGPDRQPLVGHSVSVELLPIDGPAADHAEVSTDGEGRVAFDLPPLDGRYRVQAGGGELRYLRREVTLIDGQGHPLDPGELELDLQEGAVIALTFQRSGGGSLGGRVVLTGTTSDGPLFGMFGYRVSLEQEFEQGSCVLDGLPPLKGEVRVFFEDGQELRFDVAVPLGTTPLNFDL